MPVSVSVLPVYPRRRPLWARLAVAALLTTTCIPFIPAVAHAAPKLEKQTAPVLLEADRFAYDAEKSLIMAIGGAEVVQNDYVLLADKIIYNQKTGVVTAEGNVAVSDETGDVYFAERAVLENEIKTGIIYNFSSRFADDSLFAANQARRVSDTVTELDYAVYSPCKVCDEEGNPKKPFWQMKAKHIKIDEEEQKVTYRNAWFEFFELPVFFTPYFSHATPDADRKSGLLIPSYTTSSNLGTVIRMPYYWNIAPQMDAIITPINTTSEGPVLAAEFRHLLDKGMYNLEGSITHPEGDSATGTPADEDYRWHIEGKGDYRLSNFWRTGFTGKRASDDTYLRRYDFGNEDLLTSKVYAGGFENRTSLNIEAISFQGLRIGDNADTIPLIHPLVSASHETAPGWNGSRFGVNGNLMALSREIGAQSRRVSTSGYWKMPGITKAGHVFEVRPQLRADLYSVENVTATTTGGALDEYDGVAGRIVPEVWFDWRYPLLRRFKSSSLVIEPTANLILGMNNVNSDKIPNEDSLALEFSDTNLFSDNHYTGYDLAEGGTRVNYGIRGQWDYDYASGSNVEFLIGQNYHTDDNNLFPYSNDLNNQWSDIVGRLAWNYSNNLRLGYRFRLDQEELDLQRSELNG
ncbi:MAG: LPS-assembly protein LptD, partial [Alphaproteobacteria bacterium]|nr:LPS-assembly protein LptD [Alphaproteobacteria bacterium]